VCLFFDGDLGFTPDIGYGKNNGHLSWWPYGIANYGSFSRESARYVADYLLKEMGAESDFIRSPPFRLVSLGLAKRYFEDNRLAIENTGLRFGSSYIGTPRYYRKRMINWIDETGIPLRNTKFVSSLKGARWIEYGSARAEQRKRNVVTRQVLYSRSN